MTGMRQRFFKDKVLFFSFLVFFLTFQIFLLRHADLQLNDGFLLGGGEQLELRAGGSILEDTDLPEIVIGDLATEIKKGRDYVDSVKSTRRKLKFVHIPKTAGTTIEEVGGIQAKVDWGSCLFQHIPKRIGVCEYPPGQFEWPPKIGWWHLPAQLFPLKGIDPYDDADLFTVVRDPNDRLLSEFLYRCRRKVSKFMLQFACNNSLSHEPAYMNEWLQGKMNRPSLSSQNSSTGTTPLYQPKDYLHLNGHFIPQYDFVITHGDIRMIDYVLRMEHLNEDFDPLMVAYGLNAVMSSSKKKNVARNVTDDLGPRDFDETTQNLVEDMYLRDFDLLTNRRKKT